MHYFGVALQQPTTTDEQSYQEYNLGEETGIPREIEIHGAKSGSAISMEENVKVTPYIIFRCLYNQTRSYPKVRENT